MEIPKTTQMIQAVYGAILIIQTQIAAKKRNVKSAKKRSWSGQRTRCQTSFTRRKQAMWIWVLIKFYEEEAGNVTLSTHQEHDCNLQESVATSQDEEQGGATNEVCVQNTASTGHMGQDCFIKEIVATNQEEEQGGATNEDIVHMGQDCTIKEIVATIEEEEQGGTMKNQVSSFIDEEFAFKMATTQEEEHVRTTNNGREATLIERNLLALPCLALPCWAQQSSERLAS